MPSLANLAKREERYVLSRYEEYLKQRNNNHRIQQKEADVLKWILTKNPPRNRQGTWSASSGGSCPRKQQFVYHGLSARTPTTDLLNVFANGDYLHLRYQVAGLIGGWITDVEVPVVIESSKVRGTMDGMLDNGEVLELKSINSRGYRETEEYGPKLNHQYQATAYIIASGAPAVRFVYENKDTNHNREFLFVPDQEMIDLVTRNWNELNAAEEEGRYVEQLPECRQMKGSEYSWCDFKDICMDAVFPKNHDQVEASRG